MSKFLMHVYYHYTKKAQLTNSYDLLGKLHIKNAFSRVKTAVL